MTALGKIKWLQDVFVTRKEEMHFDVDISIKQAFDEAIKELEELENRSCYMCKHKTAQLSADIIACDSRQDIFDTRYKPFDGNCERFEPKEIE